MRIRSLFDTAGPAAAGAAFGRLGGPLAGDFRFFIPIVPSMVSQGKLRSRAQRVPREGAQHGPKAQSELRSLGQAE